MRKFLKRFLLKMLAKILARKTLFLYNYSGLIRMVGYTSFEKIMSSPTYPGSKDDNDPVLRARRMESTQMKDKFPRDAQDMQFVVDALIQPSGQWKVLLAAFGSIFFLLIELPSRLLEIGTNILSPEQSTTMMFVISVIVLMLSLFYISILVSMCYYDFLNKKCYHKIQVN